MARSQALALALAAALLLGLLALWTAAPARGQPAAGGAVPDADVVMLMAGGAGEAKAEQLAGSVQGDIVAAIPQLGAYLVDLPLESRVAQEAAADTLEGAGAVRDADPALTFRLAGGAPLALNDPLLGSEWHLGTIRASQAWAQQGLGDPGVVIAVVDTGVDYTHPDLAGKVILGADLANGDDDPLDTQGHGTHVAGIAAAIAGNGIGVAGVCPGCSVLAVKVFPDGATSTSDFTVAQGIVWATDHGANVINLSLGGPAGSSVSQAAVDYAWSHGVVVVAAAGNGASSTPSYPAAFPNAIAVAATTSADTLASFSSFGSWVDVSAPGQGILSTVSGGGYQSWSGTSMATPVVAGAAGLAFSALGGDAAAVRSALEAGAVDLGAPGRDDSFGWGRIDLPRVLAPVSPPSVDTSALPSASAGSPYSTLLAASGGVAPYAWSIVLGTLPAGLSLDSATGRIAGTPSAAGSFPLTVRVADAAGGTAARALTLDVRPSVDLSGSWVSVSRRSSTVSSLLEVRATGGTVSSAFAVRFSILSGTRVVATRTVTVAAGLGPTTPARVSLTWKGSYRGYTLRAEIDRSAQVAEPNEANNTLDARIP